VVCIDGALIASLLGAIGNDNVKREFYLTDVVAIARAAGHNAIAVRRRGRGVPGRQLRAANSRRAEKAMQQRLRSAAFEAGVSMTIRNGLAGRRHEIRCRRHDRPQRSLRPGVSVGAGTEIKAFCDIEGARIGRDVIIGPSPVSGRFRVADEVHIGNFVELKAPGWDGAPKANHLAYLGDSDIGSASNIGAGTIAVNYDGFGKWRTVVGAEAFVGSNSSLVRRWRIGRAANVTAGSVITEDVPAGAVAFGGRGSHKEGRAGHFVRKLKARALAAKRAKKE